MHNTLYNLPPGFVIAGLAGGSGKSVVAVGLTAALAKDGIKIAPFKKGPDYIDAGWLQTAAGQACHNLDPYLMAPEIIQQSFLEHAAGHDIALVEGNRGLFDGVDAEGTYSTAELADILGLPIFLVVDCTKTTRTVAALLLGCQQMAGKNKITGVILNRIGSTRHESIIRKSIEFYTDIKVLGAIPRLNYDVFPQRHIGITPCQEFDGASQALDNLAAVISKSCNLDFICNMAEKNSIKTFPESHIYKPWQGEDLPMVKIGVIKDAAFQFYYPENIKALELCGAEIIEINALQESKLPELDGLYIGGGFPENSVSQLADNQSFRSSLKEKITNGLPVYAECGGLIYLGSKIEVEGHTYPLTDIFPVAFKMEKKPQAHGYTILSAADNNPFFPKGEEIKGHEFRYSKITAWQGDPASLAFKMKRGCGFMDKRDGLVYKNTLALYTHIHALGTPQWARYFVDKVREVKNGVK